MSFIRIKKIRSKEYAYLVENEWKHKGSRQKVKGYIGSVYRFDLNKDIEFLHFVKSQSVEEYINQRDIKKIIDDLIKWEFFKFGISSEQFYINFNEKKIQKGKKQVALLINSGFMCSLTLKNLLEFEAEDNEANDGYRFARAFVEAGIKVPEEIFVGMFGKFYKISN